MTDPQLPFSQDAELALLGSVLIDPGLISEIDLDAEEFYVHRHRFTWEAIQSMRVRGVQPDIITLSEELTHAGKLQECGGPSWIVGLINETPTSLGAHEYAQIVRQMAQRRRAIQVGTQVVRAAYDLKVSLPEVVAAAVDELTMGVRPKSGAVHIRAAISDLYDEINRQALNPQDVWGLPTLVADYDKATGGLQPGEVVYIAGQPGVGKSILSMQMGFNLGSQEIPGAIYSLEMRANQVVRRALSAHARIPTRALKSGQLEDHQWPVLTNAIETISAYPVYICDAPMLTVGQLRADLARLKARHGIRWFVLDYLYLMGTSRRMEDTERLSYLSRNVKGIAGEFELAAITVNSVVKEAMDNSSPKMKNLRISGEGIHAADIILELLPHRPAYGESERKNMRTAVFTKGREMEGSLGFFHLVKQDTWPAFENYTREPNAQRANGGRP